MRLEIEQIDEMYLVTDHDKCVRHIYSLAQLIEMMRRLEIGQRNRSIAQAVMQSATQRDLQAQTQTQYQQAQNQYNATNDYDQTRGF